MKRTKVIKILFALLAAMLCLGRVGLAEPVGTAFTYQGRLIDNNQPADGLYDLQFKLFDASSDGNQLGLDVNIAEVDVIDGYFTVELDFSSVFDGNDRWLDIGVRPGDLNDPNAYNALSPRQKVTPTPHAIYAKTAQSVSGGVDWSGILNIPAGFADGTDDVGLTSEIDPTVAASVKDGVDWIEVTSIPGGFADGVDDIGLTSETDPTVLASVKDGVSWSEISSRPAGLDDGDQVGITSESDPTVAASVKDGVSWGEVSGIPAGFADGIDNVGLTAETDPQVGTINSNYVPKWDGSALVTGAIYDNGNVGVGTTDPTGKLDVVGEIVGTSISVPSIGERWSARESNNYWASIAMSDDGRIQAATGLGTIYISRDYGYTWTAATQSGMFDSVAMSADGTKITVIDYDTRFVYLSTDTGNTWTPISSTISQTKSIAMSADGTIQTAGTQNHWIYVSTDSGHTWTSRGTSLYWISVAMSADGTKQTAVAQGGQIYVSTNSGSTWTAKGPALGWQSVAMSADGTIQRAVFVGGAAGGSYVSTDSGNTWALSAPYDAAWRAVAMSADGTTQAAAGDNSQIYISTDSGNTWTPKGYSAGWKTIAMSADGTKQTAAPSYGRLYVSYSGGSVNIGTKVGIGTTTPDASLQVNGSMKVFGGRVWKANNVTPPASPNPYTVVSDTADTDGFVVGMVETPGATGICWIEGSVGGIVYGKAAANVASGSDNPVKCNSFTMPVRKGESWSVTYQWFYANDARVWVYWVPLGI